MIILAILPLIAGVIWTELSIDSIARWYRFLTKQVQRNKSIAGLILPVKSSL